MRAGVLKAPAIIEDRRRALELLMIARADGEPPTLIEGIASGVKVTVKKAESTRPWIPSCDLQGQELRNKCH